MELDMKIDEDELVTLALDLANVASPAGDEGAASDFVFDWLDRNGIEPRRIAMFPERPNVLGTVAGRSDGYSLLLNSHLDTGKRPTDFLGLRDPENPVYNSASRRGDLLIGEGIVNDKGPMAATLIAAKAIKQFQHELTGDLLVSAVCGEIGVESVDEFSSPRYLSKEVGTRFLVQHGAVADFALVAECTDFGAAWIEAGKAFFKITIEGEQQAYTPFVPVVAPGVTHPNAIVRSAAVVAGLQEWGNRYEERNTYKSTGGTIVPKVTIGAIRGGSPELITRTAEVCILYVDVRTVPGQDPLAIRAELRELVKGLGVPASVELFLYRPSFEPIDPGALLQATREAHEVVRGSQLGMARSPFSSMWRDIIVFMEMGIPTLTYGPARGFEELSMNISDLVDAANIYARIGLKVCTTARERKPIDS